MSGGVPPSRQCTFPGCGREKIDPSDVRGLCEAHLEGIEPSRTGESDARDVADVEENPRGSSTVPDAQAWDAAEFDDPQPGTWPPELLEREQWMGHIGKKPFAPWADRDHPEADDDGDARWKWGIRHTSVVTLCVNTKYPNSWVWFANRGTTIGEGGCTKSLSGSSVTSPTG